MASPQILVVDDDPLFTRIVCDFLRDRGMDVSSASDAAGAREAVAHCDAAVALVDLYLGEDDGLAVCRDLRESAPDASVLLMTARPEGFALSDAFGPIADDFFVKGNDLEELGRRVAARLEQHMNLRSIRQRERMLAQVVMLARAISPYHDLSALLPALQPLLSGLPGVTGVRLELSPKEGVATFTVLEAGEEIGADGVSDARSVAMIGEDRVEILPLGHGPMGRLLLRMHGSAAIDPDVLDTLSGIVASAISAARLFETLKERQARLERGYVERHRQLARLTARLERLSDARDSFLALLSHDLRSPISVVLGHCQLIEEGLVAPTQFPKAIDTIQRQAERMSRMVEDLLDRYRHGESATAPRENGDLARVAREMAATFEPVAARRKQTLVLETVDVAPIDANMGEIREVFANLLENALRHSPERSVVTLTVTAGVETVEVAVRDEGPGFGAAAEMGGSGLGLGLKACARIVAEAGGTLRAASLPGGGAQATFTLPLALPRTTRAAVWILCGDVSRLEQLTEVVGRHWETVTGTDADDALARMRASVPSVLVLDASVSGVGDALELLKVMKTDPDLAAVPVIMLAPAGAPAWVERAHTLGALTVLPRPLDVEMLIGHVRRAVRLVAAAMVAVAGRAPDTLTGLETAMYVGARLPELVEECRAARRPLPAVHVDIVDLKHVNRAYGWVVGDQLLLWVAGVVRDRARPGDLVGRVEDDAFLLVMPGRTSEEAEGIALEIEDAIGKAKPRLGVSRVSVQVTARAVDVTTRPPDALAAPFRAKEI